MCLFCIVIYQKTISPDHGWFKDRYPFGFCRFFPTCSQYGYMAIQSRGIIIGGLITIGRILRCNPCFKGGEDFSFLQKDLFINKKQQ